MKTSSEMSLNPCSQREGEGMGCMAEHSEVVGMVRADRCSLAPLLWSKARIPPLAPGGW